ncbi:hypothetical protein PIB30_055953 [Stylosanthes scabra]|uniref:Uncharacterized protein n=1 Tax=Stylosanthes scabra TaxID=79078 RepID=A0ABU6QJ30_9FABA|nr:hypothetical protein [Stylosanthes scabra]
MDRKRSQAVLKGKEKVRAPPTRMSPRLAAVRAPQSPPLKMRTPPSRASPRLAALKDSPLPPLPTSVLMPKKLVVLALAVPKPILLQKNEERKLEEQERRNSEHSTRAPTPRRGDSRLGIQSSSPGLSHPRLGMDTNA